MVAVGADLRAARRE